MPPYLFDGSPHPVGGCFISSRNGRCGGKAFTDSCGNLIPQKWVIDLIAHWSKNNECSRVGVVIHASRLPTTNVKLNSHLQSCMNQIENSPVNEWNHYDYSDRIQNKDSWNPVLTEKPLIMNGFSIDPNTSIANVDRVGDGESFIKHS